MLGQDLCPTLEDLGHELIETDIDNLDITDFDAVEKFLTANKPDTIMHLVAYTNVDKAEDEPEKAELINAKGTENLAIMAARLDIPIVQGTGEKAGKHRWQSAATEALFRSVLFQQ